MTQTQHKEAWRAIREAGIVGEGGAGFPTHIKYKDPTKILIVNAAESEPGYYADKLLVRAEPDLFLDALEMMRTTFGFERIVFACKEKDVDTYFEDIKEAAEDHGFEFEAVEDKYKLGEEKALTERVTDREVPSGGIAKDVDVTMNNVETLWNIHKAITEDRPLMRKLVQSLGEVDVRVFDVPIGAPVVEILEAAGFDRSQADTHRLIDGGPLLGEEVEDFGEDCDYGVSGRTNGLLLCAKDKFDKRVKEYPLEHEPPESIERLDDFDVVRLRLDAYPGAPATPVVEEGDSVDVGDRVADPAEDELSVAVHASIKGRIRSIDEDVVDIVPD